MVIEIAREKRHRKIIEINSLPPLPLGRHTGLSELRDGTRIGRYGTLTFILGDDGNPKSYPFHEIDPVTGGYKATLGSLEFRLDKEGKIKSGDYPIALIVSLYQDTMLKYHDHILTLLSTEAYKRQLDEGLGLI